MIVYQNIDEIVIDDKKWRQMARAICGDKMQADEYVNQFYLKYMELKHPPKEIHAGYIHTSINRLHQRNKDVAINSDAYDEMINISGDEMDQDFYNYDYKSDVNNHVLHANVMKDLQDLEWFHSKLFTLVIVDGHSMREIERQTGITFNTIQSSIATTKKYLKNKYK
jgi:DNA-directed RNA polymerase specialized sigma24 family protein